MYGANTSGIILGTIILDSSQRIFLKLIAEETEEDVERNENICRQTDNQVINEFNNWGHLIHCGLWIVGERANKQ